MHPHLSVHEQLVDTETEFGPTVTPNSPAVLRQLLDEFEDIVRAQGAPVDGHLAPGISRETLTEQLGSVGLAPPEELVTWFAWHNGLQQPPGGRLRADCLPPCITPSSLARALGRYYTDADADHEEGPWNSAPGWLMLNSSQDGLAISCQDNPTKAPLVRSADMDNPLWAEHSSQQVVSLCTAVSYWIRTVELGVHSWNRETQRWDYDSSRIPPLLNRSGLVN